MKISFLENEFWYGSCVKYGMKMPFTKGTKEIIDFTINKTPNQAMPLLLSTKGRIIWRDTGYKVEFNKGYIIIPDDCILEKSGDTLKDAYLYAMKKYFPFEVKTPAKQLFEKVIYNTWIELTFFQNENDILNYANNIIKSGMQEGVIIIDDGWSEYYGDWTFHKGKFKDAKDMIERLHLMGFKVMVWICPYVSPDSIKFREAKSLDILIKDKSNEVFISKWWNGYSAVLDFSNPNAIEWLEKQLEALKNIGVDGFKFDAGDSIYYREDNITYRNVSPNEQSRLWAKFGEKYSFNEYRVTFKAGGYALMQRLCDKEHSWGEGGIASLIPDVLLQGITGHPYSCPDMIGGGEYLNFKEMESLKLDEELFVRHCEIACLMPAMQFSAAPFRLLNKNNFNSILKSTDIRKKYIPYIMELIENVAKTGEPLIRYMSYEFPDEKVECITNQFMLGNKYLVAPIYEKNKNERNVYVPKGLWKYEDIIINSDGNIKNFKSTLGVPIILERI